MTKPPFPEPKFEVFSITADGHEFPHGETCEVVLPCCGHKVSYAYRGPQTEEAISSGREGVKTWLRSRWQRHDCALVSPENPHGLRPIETEDRPLAAYTFQCCGARAAYGLPVNLDEPTMAKVSKGLLDWARGRESMHRCELVSAQNPFGWEDRAPV